jgi:hypothetical protein
MSPSKWAIVWGYVYAANLNRRCARYFERVKRQATDAISAFTAD